MKEQKQTQFNSDTERRLLEYLRKKGVRMRDLANLFGIKEARNVKNSTIWKERDRPGRIIEFLEKLGHKIP